MPTPGERSYPGSPSFYADDPSAGGSFRLPSVDFGAFGRAAGSFVKDAGVGTLASGAGTVLSFVGSLVAARQAKKAADYNAEVLRRNAQMAAQADENEALQRQRNAAILLQDIGIARQAQAEEERAQRLHQAQVAGTTRAIIASSGLLLRGSPLAVYEHNLRESEREILLGRYRTDLQERAIRDQATMEGYAAQMARFSAGERLRVGNLQGSLARYGGSQQQLANLLGGVGGLASGVARTTAAYERHQASRGPTSQSPAGFETLF